MNQIHAFLFLIAFPIIASADTFDIGGRTITIPSPAGYVRVTNDMPTVKRIVDQMVDQSNDMLAFYIRRDFQRSFNH